MKILDKDTDEVREIEEMYDLNFLNRSILDYIYDDSLVLPSDDIKALDETMLSEMIWYYIRRYHRDESALLKEKIAHLTLIYREKTIHYDFELNEAIDDII